MSASTSTHTDTSHRPTTWTTGYEIGTFAKISGTKYRGKLDERALARLGKRQELKRRFGFLSVFSFSCCILVTWESALVLSKDAFINGGPAGIAWGYLLAWMSSFSVYICLAEMASIAPISGGQYFWVAILSPARYKRFLSYVTGWVTTLAWIATIGTGIVFVGTLIQGMMVLEYEDYHPKSWQGTLLCWAVLAVAVFINILLAGFLPFLEAFILFLHVLGFVAVMITLLYLSPKVSAADVFFRTLNGGHWHTQGLSFCVGFTGNVATFVGADAAVHMAEEIENAASVVPRAILWALLINGMMGFGMVLAFLFCVTDIQGAENTKTGYPFMEVFATGCGDTAATILTAFVAAMIWFAVIGYLATASRMMWSFARDRALPFHNTIRKVTVTTSVPIYAIIITTIIPCLLALIYLGSPVAYQDVLSMSVSGLYASYLMPCSLLLWRRTTGQIQAYDSTAFITSNEWMSAEVHTLSRDSMMEKDVVVDVQLMWGPWRVPGLLGTLNNGYACTYCVFVLFWSFWPTTFRPNASQMNYAVVSFVAVTGFSITYYFIYGHKKFKGPLVEAVTPRPSIGN